MSIHLNKLLSITQFLADKPNLDALTNYLSLEHCPSGEVSRVYFAKISSNSTITIEAAVGFEPENCYVGKVIPVEIDRPSGRSILENKIFFEINTPQYYLDYPAIRQAPLPYPWKSQVSIPVNSQYFMQCGRYAEISEGDELFYQNLQSLMKIYFSSMGSAPRENGNLYGKELTERQAEIIKLMKAGKTNDEIAQMIGFSASLVKQETMLVFAKLGISGRKDLTATT